MRLRSLVAVVLVLLLAADRGRAQTPPTDSDEPEIIGLWFSVDADESDYEAAVAATRGTDRLLLLDFTSYYNVHDPDHWCDRCQEMRRTWEDPRVQEWVRQYGVVTIVDGNVDDELARDYAIEMLPTVVVVRDEREIGRRAGYQDADAFLAWLAELVAELPGTPGDTDELPSPGEVTAEYARDVHRRARDLLGRGAGAEALPLFLWLWGLPHHAFEDWSRKSRSLLIHDTRRLRGSGGAARELFELLERRVHETMASEDPPASTWKLCADLAAALAEVPRLLAWARDSGVPATVRSVADALRAAELPVEAGRLAEDPVAEANRLIELARSDLPGAPRAPTRLEEELLDHYIEALEQGRPDDVWKVSKLLSQGRQKALASSAHPLMARRRLRDGLVGLYVASLEQGRDADASKIAALAIHTTPGADVLLELAYEAQSRGLPRFEQFAWLHRVPDLTNHDAPRRRALRMVTYLDWALYEQACGRDFEPLTPEWRRPEIRAAHAAGEDRGR